jgi:DnaJ-class molecular chaperone
MTGRALYELVFGPAKHWDRINARTKKAWDNAGKQVELSKVCPDCNGTGSVRNRGDDFTTTVEAAATYEQTHGDMPAYRVCKCWFANSEAA